jgi:hypothetical protein
VLLWQHGLSVSDTRFNGEGDEDDGQEQWLVLNGPEGR